jgi:hypothetical protein
MSQIEQFAADIKRMLESERSQLEFLNKPGTTTWHRHGAGPQIDTTEDNRKRCIENIANLEDILTRIAGTV